MQDIYLSGLSDVNFRSNKCAESHIFVGRQLPYLRFCLWVEGTTSNTMDVTFKEKIDGDGSYDVLKIGVGREGKPQISKNVSK